MSFNSNRADTTRGPEESPQEMKKVNANDNRKIFRLGKRMGPPRLMNGTEV
jgi:hypothetical protein